ncbi:MAG: hypothetical protein M3256_13715 [Actinomycetota bacterium]|nr:hypothetical protein [Actinomycetota bacterium]MDQ6947291.1 hypothetical protein [Actinomycetota bacterium]
MDHFETAQRVAIIESACDELARLLHFLVTASGIVAPSDEALSDMGKQIGVIKDAAISLVSE